MTDTKQKPEQATYVIHKGMASYGVCTSLPDAEALDEINTEAPWGVRTWEPSEGEASQPSECPDFEGHRHLWFTS